MLMLVAFIISFLILLYHFVKTIRKTDQFNQIPEPPSLPILGHVVTGLRLPIVEVLNEAEKYFKHFGNTVKVRVGPFFYPFFTVIFTSDPKFIEFMLSSNKFPYKSLNYGFLKPWLGNGLLLSHGKYWTKHRKILTPTFHFEILRDFVEIFESVGKVLVEKLNQNGSSDVDLEPLVTLCTLDIICESAMGVKLNTQSGENSEYVKSVNEMCRIVTGRVLSIVEACEWTFWFTKNYHRQKKALTVLHNFTLGVINSRRQTQKVKRTKRMAFLDLLLKFCEDEELLTVEEIREEVDTFMFEGHHTTATGICFTLYCLAHHNEVQEKVFQEQNELFGGEKDPVVTYEELQKMKYLEYVIKETFRLYPPVPLLGRRITQDTNYDGCCIPRNTNFVIFIYHLHRNPIYFPEPEKFIPERFENLDTSSPYAYIPFSAGSRNCIGQKFAMLEIKSIISNIIRHFEIKPTFPPHELKLSPEVVLRSINGIRVAFKARY